MRKRSDFLYLLLLVWFFAAYSDSRINNEYQSIVRVLKPLEVMHQCTIDTKVKRHWPYSWAIVGLDMTVSSPVDSLTVVTDNYTRFDKMHLEDDYLTQYHFFWNDGDKGNRSAYFLDFKLQYSKTVVDLSVGYCANYPVDKYKIQSLDACLVPPVIISCSPDESTPSIYGQWILQSIQHSDDEVRVLEEGNFIIIEEDHIFEVIKGNGKRRYSYNEIESDKLLIRSGGVDVEWVIKEKKNNELKIQTPIGLYFLKR